MSNPGTCPRCGAGLAEESGGICPRCSIELALGDARTSQPDEVAAEVDRVGPYEIERVLGEGGMGVVYLATQQEPVRRTVALKLIKPGMDSRAIVARFEAERQVLALMDHPNVAKMYDGGTAEDGRLFFAMEFVEGEPITLFCDRYKLSIQDRLRLFLAVCDGVQHAHHKGVTHRDLKPSNILVSGTPSDPRPKIIDFGVAKAVGGHLTDRTLVTQIGQLLGTPEYMSPEQAGSSARDVDSRTDVYSLGVVLYEMLSGVLPVDPGAIRHVAIHEACRYIQEHEPTEPSRRLATLAGEEAQRLADLRSSPSHLARELRGDLDWVTMKALAKERDRRYDSPNALADDIRRFLADEPVSTGPPGARYRFGKFCRRHRLGVAAGAAIALSVLVGAGAATYGYVRATRAESLARAEADVSREVVDFMTRLFEISDPSESRGAHVTVREVLDRGAARIDGEFQRSPLVRARLGQAMGRAYKGLGFYERAEGLLRPAVDAQRDALGEEDPATLKAKNDLGMLELDLGNYPAAVSTLQQTLSLRSEVLGAKHADTLVTRSQLGLALLYSGKLEDAQEELQATVDAWEGRDNSYERRAAIHNLAIGRAAAADFAGAEAAMREVLALQSEAMGDDHPETLVLRSNLAQLLSDAGKLDDALNLAKSTLAHQRRVLGEDHPDLQRTMTGLAGVHFQRREVDEAERLYREVLASIERTLPPGHPDRWTSAGNVATVLGLRQERQEAFEIFDRCYREQAEFLGEDHPNTLASLFNSGSMLEGMLRFDEAEERYRRALEATLDALGPTHRDTIFRRSETGNLLRRMGREEDAYAMQKQATELAREHLTPSVEVYLTSHVKFGWTCRHMGRLEEAREAYGVAEEGATAKYGRRDGRTQFVIRQLIEISDELGDEATAAGWRQALADAGDTTVPMDGNR